MAFLRTSSMVHCRVAGAGKRCFRRGCFRKAKSQKGVKRDPMASCWTQGGPKGPKSWILSPCGPQGPGFLSKRCGGSPRVNCGRYRLKRRHGDLFQARFDFPRTFFPGNLDRKQASASRRAPTHLNGPDLKTRANTI